MDSPHYPACPRCRAASSRPDRIAYEDASEARIVMRCDACRHRWSALVPVDEEWPEMRQQLLRQSSWRDQA